MKPSFLIIDEENRMQVKCVLFTKEGQRYGSEYFSLPVDDKPEVQLKYQAAQILYKKAAAEYAQYLLGDDQKVEVDERVCKREAYTVATNKAVVLNIETNTPDWIKSHVETRRILRRARRGRKTPYRACRENRSSLRNPERIPPSTKARWNCKLRILSLLFRILPITHLRLEEISAETKKGKKKWNLSFSPLQVGKDYFEKSVALLYPNLIFSKSSGKETHDHRAKRGFHKIKDKLSYSWEAHCVDSHSLCEMSLESDISPVRSLYKITFLQFHRRQLHVQNAAEGGIRKPYGTTVSFGMPRGSVLRYKNDLVFLGGSSKNRLSIHSLENGKRISQNIRKEEITMLYASSYRTQFLRQDKPGGILVERA
ncbi:unnamed protein product [Sphagnum jensenii]